MISLLVIVFHTSGILVFKISAADNTNMVSDNVRIAAKPKTGVRLRPGHSYSSFSDETLTTINDHSPNSSPTVIGHEYHTYTRNWRTELDSPSVTHSTKFFASRTFLCSPALPSVFCVNKSFLQLTDFLIVTY